MIAGNFSKEKGNVNHTYRWFIIQRFLRTPKTTSDSRSRTLNPSVHRGSDSLMHHRILAASSQHLLNQFFTYTLHYMKWKIRTWGLYKWSPVLRIHLLNTAATIYLSNYYISSLFTVCIWQFLSLEAFVFAANLSFSSTMRGVPQSALQGPWEVAERATPLLTVCESVSAEPVHRVDLQLIWLLMK